MSVWVCKPRMPRKTKSDAWTVKDIPKTYLFLKASPIAPVPNWQIA